MKPRLRFLRFLVALKTGARSVVVGVSSHASFRAGRVLFIQRSKPEMKKVAAEIGSQYLAVPCSKVKVEAVDAAADRKGFHSE